MKLRVIPLTKKMKERVKAHGDVWLASRFPKKGEQISLSTSVLVYKVDDKMYPYERWCTIGVDCDVERIKPQILTGARAVLKINGVEIPVVSCSFTIDKEEE